MHGPVDIRTHDRPPAMSPEPWLKYTEHAMVICGLTQIGKKKKYRLENSDRTGRGETGGREFRPGHYPLTM